MVGAAVLGTAFGRRGPGATAATARRRRLAPPVTVPVLGSDLGPNGLAVLGQSGDPAAGPAWRRRTFRGWTRPACWVRTRHRRRLVQVRASTPNLHAFNNAYGPQQNLVPSAPGEGEQFDVAPGEENADVNARTWMGRYIDMYRAGMLKGGLLGQVPQEQLGEPLPGTALPPGTNIPPGLGQYLPGPAEGAPPG